ncbi:hypothetical protein ACV3RL_12890, partial [Clostridium perfringens]
MTIKSLIYGVIYGKINLVAERHTNNSLSKLNLIKKLKNILKKLLTRFRSGDKLRKSLEGDE